jgi:hypothetical protein
MFPFKFELTKAITDYFTAHYSGENQNINSSITRPLIPMMAVYLMFLDLADHNKLNKELKSLKLDHYIYNLTKEASEYVKSLPKVVYTMHMYENEEFELLRYYAFHFQNAVEYKIIHDHIVKYIHEHYPQYEVLYYLFRI